MMAQTGPALTHDVIPARRAFACKAMLVIADAGGTGRQTNGYRMTERASHAFRAEGSASSTFRTIRLISLLPVLRADTGSHAFCPSEPNWRVRRATAACYNTKPLLFLVLDTAFVLRYMFYGLREGRLTGNVRSPYDQWKWSHCNHLACHITGMQWLAHFRDVCAGAEYRPSGRGYPHCARARTARVTSRCSTGF
jgi:hypothetical protein